jgi:hypothetical protein
MNLVYFENMKEAAAQTGTLERYEFDVKTGMMLLEVRQ